MSNDKELIWVDKKFAEEFKKLESVEHQENAVKSILNKKKIDLEAENELLSESMLQFKSCCLSHRKELEKVYSEQNEKLEKLWEDFGDISSSIHKHKKELSEVITSATKSIDSLFDKVSKLKKHTENVSIYGAHQLIELAKLVSAADGSTKAILRELLNREK